jgi:predicted dehydrogenase
VKPLGIAVVGRGRAGRARIAAVQAQPAARLVAVVERGGTPDLPAMLADPAVEAVLVCTPNLLHAQVVERALEAGKHVCVEYPLAEGPEQARALFALARQSDRVLHVEHIEILTPAQAGQRERARELGRPHGGTLEFSGGFDGWIADPALAGTPGLLALARLHRLVDLFGEARVASACLEPVESGYALRVDVEFGDGGHTALHERRAPGLARRLRWAIACERGVLEDPPPLPVEGLFARDLAEFLSRVISRAQSYVSDARVVHGLELVHAIDRILQERLHCC